MRRVRIAWAIAGVLLIAAVPVLAQEADIDDETMVLDVVQMVEQNDPAPAGAPGQLPPSQVQGPPGRGYRSGYGPGTGQWYGHGSYLGLTQDQITRMRDVWNRFYLDTRNLRYDLMQKRLEMRRLFTDPKADAAALQAKQRELSAIRQKLMDRRAQAVIEWRSLLTPQQVQKLDIFSMAHRGMGPGFGCGMGGGMMGYGGAVGYGDAMGRGGMMGGR